MKKPNIPSPIVLIIGIAVVFSTVYLLTRILTMIDVKSAQIPSDHLFTNKEFHTLQGLCVVFGSMLGALITSLLSPKNEISRSIMLGSIIMLLAVIGGIRSQTQSLLDTTHLIIFIFTIPGMIVVASAVQKRRSAD